MGAKILVPILEARHVHEYHPYLPAWFLLLASWILCALAMGVLWARQLRTRNATSVDAAWSALIGICGGGMALLAEGSPVQRGVAAAVALGWSARLTFHLLRDRVFGHAEEDGRYRAMRDHWGASAGLHFAWFYQAQALAALAFSLPFLLAANNPEPQLATVQWLGIGLAVFAVLGEGLADRQLAAHRNDPTKRGLACRSGLWRYSRHPNYFCEWLVWCGIAMLCWPAPQGAWGLLAPAVMFVLVRFVTGVPYAELRSLKSRGDDFRRYMTETNTFVPWFPRLPKAGAS